MTFKEESWCACGAHTVIEARDSLEAYAARSVWHGAHKDHHASTSPAEPLPAPERTGGLILEPLPPSDDPGYTHRGSRETRTRDADGQREIRSIVTGEWVPYLFEEASRPEEQAVVEAARGVVAAFTVLEGRGVNIAAPGTVLGDTLAALRAALARSTPAPSDGGEA